jgi:hypothetical protein
MNKKKWKRENDEVCYYCIWIKKNCLVCYSDKNHCGEYGKMKKECGVKK